MERRLSAILAADMVGYSRLMEADEAGTIGRQKAHRKELIDLALQEFNGRIVKEMGDGLLVEFPSVVNAISCAMAIQQAMPERETSISEDRRIAYRVGIHLGDVVVEGDDLIGDGVNVAARIEQLCEPGGICISGTAYDQIEGRSEFACAFLGEKQLKNISRPVRAYRVSLAADGSSDQQAIRSAPALPDKPSIAVLPFDNMSGDPEQEYFSDGVTEDIITALSRLHWLFVIARNSTFTYKGQAIDITKVGRDLGVRYVLEGSVRKSGSRMRVTAQLIEAASGKHIWAERYDRDLVDIFALQDELTEAISAMVDAELAAKERHIARNKTGINLDAWELFQRGMWHLYKFGKDNVAEARRLFQKASEQSPDFASAHAGLAYTAFIEAFWKFTPEPAATLRQGLQDAERAVSLDNRDDFALFALGRICTNLGDKERAISVLENAIDLNPSHAASYFALGHALSFAGRQEEAISLITRALRLSPRDPYAWTFYNLRGSAYLSLQKYELAIADAKAAIRGYDQFLSHLLLTAAYDGLEMEDEARASCKRALAMEPALSLEHIGAQIAALESESRAKFLEALRKFGMPEK